MSTPLRIVMVLPTYMPETFGGAEQQARKLSRALGARGVDVTIVAPRLLATTARREVDGGATVTRLRVRRAPNLGGRYLASFLMWSLKLAWHLYATRKRYDVIHVVHGRLHAVPAAVAGCLLGKPVIVKPGRGGEHFDLKIVKEKRLGGPLFWRAVARLPTAYIANSHEIVADLRTHGIAYDCIHQLPNGVEIPPAALRRRDRAYGEPHVRFLYVGRLDPEKALDRMIRGFVSIDAGAAARLTLVGDGACRDALVDLVRELSAGDRVSILPPVADVGPLLRDADFHVSTSLSEGMSNALLESLSWGTPAIVSRVSGVEDIVRHGESGLVFEAGDDEAYMAALRRALAVTRAEWAAMSQAAFTTAQATFSIDGVADRHVAIYRRLLDPGAVWPRPRSVEA